MKTKVSRDPLTIWAWVAAVVIGLVLVVGAGTTGLLMSIGYVQCDAAGQQLGIATEYTPWSGCTATVLGTHVRLDR